MPATNRAAVTDSYLDAALTQIAEMNVSRLTRAQCAALLAETKALEGRLLARLLTSDETHESTGDKLLDVTQTAEMLSVSPQWVYRNARKLGFAVGLSGATLRYSTRAIQKYIAQECIEAARAVAGKDG